jgi:hypothetical protein
MSHILPQERETYTMNRRVSQSGTPALCPNTHVKEYCLEHATIFRELTEPRNRVSCSNQRSPSLCQPNEVGWKNPQGDRHFKKQQTQADNADESGQRIFFGMTCQIGDELDQVTSVLRSASTLDNFPKVLDLCMAPGSFTAPVLGKNRGARLCGISLPVSYDSHKTMLPSCQKKSRIQVCFLDIAMLAAEMNTFDIPMDHPDATNLVRNRSFCGAKFDLVSALAKSFGKNPRPEYRERREAWRLLTSQLVPALQRTKKDGTLIVLLHKMDTWNTVLMLHTFKKIRHYSRSSQRRNMR